MRKKAKFDARMVNGKFVLKGNEVAIYGINDSIIYEQLCGKCYIEKALKINNND